MISQTAAFVTRSIRQESRLLSHHLVRGGMVVALLYLLLLQVLQSARLSASGLTLISSVLSCCYWCLTFLGIMYFSVSITEEKEEETLPLLRMTGVRNVTLLLGKSLPRLAVVLLLILISAPFLMLAVTLGGVISEQIGACLLGLLCYACFLSQLGLFASTVSRNSSRAVSLTFLLWLLFELGSWLPYALARSSGNQGFSNAERFFDWVSSVWWERTMWHASDLYLMFERGEAIWHPQMTFHLISGTVFFGVSWIVFEFFNQSSIAMGASASVTGEQPRRLSSPSQQRARCWETALEWKSWQFMAGGKRWFLTWLITLPIVSIGTVIVIAIAVRENPPAEAFGITLMLVGTAAFIIQLARLFGSYLNREIYQQTLVTLCMLPRSRGTVLRHLSFGLLPFSLAPIACFSLGIFWMAAAQPDFVGDTFLFISEPWFWATMGWSAVTLHVGVVLSVYFRHGAMLIALAVCWFIVPFMLGMLFSAIAFLLRSGGGGEAFFRYLIPMTAVMVEFGICLYCQRLTVARIEELAGK